MRFFVAAMVALLPNLAFAQDDDPAAKVASLAHHIEEMRELLETTDPTMRDAAIETALSDPSAAVRGLAIRYAISRYDRLPLEFDLPAGSTVPLSSLPSIVLSRIQWTADGRSMSAIGPQCGGSNVSGQIMSDRLRLEFTQICVNGDLSGAVSNQPGTASRRMFYRDCEATMALDQARDALGGVLQCPDLPVALPLTLPLG